ncbi:MAG TPA: hypothetical protein K8U80_06730 [Collinsella ihuae]|uniref:Uncharacterized protein n=1 Tax=Collinsella ihumii TaxID=1720204 RepID=A0A921LQK9_9ACTN|nr:hypothetical protein [Collinsella ihumii]
MKALKEFSLIALEQLSKVIGKARVKREELKQKGVDEVFRKVILPTFVSNVVGLCFGTLACIAVLFLSGTIDLGKESLPYFINEISSSSMGFSATALLVTEMISPRFAHDSGYLRTFGVALLVIVCLVPAGLTVNERLVEVLNKVSLPMQGAEDLKNTLLPGQPPKFEAIVICCLACCIFLSVSAGSAWMSSHHGNRDGGN